MTSLTSFLSRSLTQVLAMTTMRDLGSFLMSLWFTLMPNA